VTVNVQRGQRPNWQAQDRQRPQGRPAWSPDRRLEQVEGAHREVEREVPVRPVKGGAQRILWVKVEGQRPLAGLRQSAGDVGRQCRLAYATLR